MRWGSSRLAWQVYSCVCFSFGNNLGFLAELKAAIYAISLAQNRGYTKIWLESDSTYVIALFANRSLNVHWSIAEDWSNCLQFISTVEFRFSHIYREGNGLADVLANAGRNCSQIMIWNELPHFCIGNFLQDLRGRSTFRFS